MYYTHLHCQLNINPIKICYFIIFNIINKPILFVSESFRYLMIFMISCIPAFEITNIVVLEQKIFELYVSEPKNF